MGLDQIVLLLAIGVVFVIHQIEIRAVNGLPERERDTIHDLLVGLWFAVALVVGVVVIEVVRLRLGDNTLFFRILPSLIGLLSAVVALAVRIRAYRTYEQAAGEDEPPRKEAARKLSRTTEWSFAGSAVVWIAITIWRISARQPCVPTAG